MVGKLRLAVAAVDVLAVATGVYGFLSAREKSDEMKLYGNVEVRQVDLSFRVDGRIEDMLVEEGNRVKAGQPIAHVTGNYFEDTLTVARALAWRAKLKPAFWKDGMVVAANAPVRNSGAAASNV